MKVLIKILNAFFFPLIALFVASVSYLNGTSSNMIINGVAISGFWVEFIVTLLSLAAVIGLLFMVAMVYFVLKDKEV
jgi:hypothetical protein